MPKTVDTRRQCELELRACNNLPQPQKRSCREGLLLALNSSHGLLVSTVFSTGHLYIRVCTFDWGHPGANIGLANFCSKP